MVQYGFSMNTKAYLVLANGQVFEGKSLGASGCIIGETVFTTGMNGYLETLTDPSFYGQIVTQTFPLIGNYGVIPPDFESDGVHVRGYIVRSWCQEPSNFRCGGDLDAFLKKQQVIGLYDIDTRALTKVLREAGVMNGILISGDGAEAKEAVCALSDATKKQVLLEKIKAYKIEHAVEAVSCSAVKVEKDAQTVFAESAAYRAVPVRADGTKVNESAVAMKDGKGKKVVLWDFGAKANIRRELLKRGLDVVTVPATATARHILAQNPDGIMLSNGPGDPQENTQIIAGIRELLAKRIKNKFYTEQTEQRSFDIARAQERLCAHFKVATLSGFGIRDNSFDIAAPGALLRYLEDTQKNALIHIKRIVRVIRSEYMCLDATTRHNLELTEPIRFDGNRKFTLLNVLDKTETAMGARLLRRWIEQPLQIESDINDRLDAVDAVFHHDARAEAEHFPRLRSAVRQFA